MAQGAKKEALFRDARMNRECACEDLDFYWDRSEFKTMKKMWNKGVGAAEMAIHFERDPDEVLIALIHLAREEKIGARATGLKGNE
jgi:serine/threonine-protein kinase RIO1